MEHTAANMASTKIRALVLASLLPNLIYLSFVGFYQGGPFPKLPLTAENHITAENPLTAFEYCQSQ